MEEAGPRVLMVDATVGNDYTLNLCSALKEAGVDVVLATTQDRQFEQAPTFKVETWAPSKATGANRLLKVFDYVAYLWKVYRYMRSGSADVVHYQFFRRERVESVFFFLLRFAGVKGVFTAHNVLPHESIALDRTLKQLVYASARQIVAHSQHLKKTLMERFGIAATKIAVIPHGNYDSFLPARPITKLEARKRLNIDNDANVILFFGYIRRYKGLELLLEAFPKAAAADKSLVLVIAGEPQTPEILSWCRSEIVKTGCESRIFQDLTYTPRDKAVLYFSACDAVVLPYKNIYHSGVIHMAYSFARPVIATKVGDFEEMVLDGKTGCLMCSNDADGLIQALRLAFLDKTRLDEMGRAGKQLNSSVYSWKTIAVQTRRLYEDVTLAGKAEKEATPVAPSTQ